MKASAYIIALHRNQPQPTTLTSMKEPPTATGMLLKKAFGKRGAMATFHTLRAFQQFKFDPNTSFAKTDRTATARAS